MKMPKIDLMALWRKLPPKDMALVRRVVDEKTWRLRGTRPKLHDSSESRYAAYIWRMVAFYISPDARHHCMPTTCFWWLPKGITKQTMQRLDGLVDKITDTVPIEEWWGIQAWAGLKSSDDVEIRKFSLKGWKHNVQDYLKDSEIRKENLSPKSEEVDKEFLSMFQE